MQSNDESLLIKLKKNDLVNILERADLQRYETENNDDEPHYDDYRCEHFLSFRCDKKYFQKRPSREPSVFKQCDLSQKAQVSLK